MKKVLALIFILLFLTYLTSPITALESSQLLLTVATFTFTIFMGFFISRQGKRYSSLRDGIAHFDGTITAIYRDFGHISKTAEKKAETIILNHYQAIIDSQEWDHHLFRPSSTITDFHSLLESSVKRKKLSTLQSASVTRILHNLDSLQNDRKQMIALHLERIPLFQWGLLCLLAFIMLVTVSFIPSYAIVITSSLKAVFALAILVALVQLWKFDHLSFFSNLLGERSNQDIIDIINKRV